MITSYDELSGLYASDIWEGSVTFAWGHTGHNSSSHCVATDFLQSSLVDKMYELNYPHGGESFRFIQQRPYL
jgi:hypothetical protein